MIDALTFLKTKARMCKYYQNGPHGCNDCPLEKYDSCLSMLDPNESIYEPVIKIVEKWGIEHPGKTRQSELLKLYPDIAIKDGAIVMCPTLFIKKNCLDDCENEDVTCIECRRKFWLEEVE